MLARCEKRKADRKRKTNHLNFYRDGNVFFAYSGNRLVYSEYTFQVRFAGDSRRGYLRQIDGSHEPSRAILRAAGSLNPHGGWYTVAFSEKGKPFAAFRNHLGVERRDLF